MLVAHLVGHAIPSPWRSLLYEPTIDPVDGNLDVPKARAPIERPISQRTAASVRPTLLSAAFADLDRRGIGWRWRRTAPQGAHAHVPNHQRLAGLAAVDVAAPTPTATRRLRPMSNTSGGRCL